MRIPYIRHKYRIGVITNVSGQSMMDLKEMSAEYGIIFEQITFPAIPLSHLRESDLAKRICEYDVVYYRTGMRGPIVSELSHMLGQRGVPLVNGVTKYPYLHEKIRQALIAGRYNIPQPKSFSVRNYNYEHASAALGPTFVIKPDDGSKGTDVALIRSKEELEKFKKNRQKDKYIYQEYIEGAEEYRVYTLAGKGVATYKKTRGSEDIRANMHAGGSATTTETERIKPLLQYGGYIARCFGADIAGIDILVKDDRYLFLELNWQPGWEQLDELTGINFCKRTLAYLLKRAHKGKPWYRRML